MGDPSNRLDSHENLLHHSYNIPRNPHTRSFRDGGEKQHFSRDMFVWRVERGWLHGGVDFSFHTQQAQTIKSLISERRDPVSSLGRKNKTWACAERESGLSLHGEVTTSLLRGTCVPRPCHGLSPLPRTFSGAASRALCLSIKIK